MGVRQQFTGGIAGWDQHHPDQHKKYRAPHRAGLTSTRLQRQP
jgi:hypothetical protein